MARAQATSTDRRHAFFRDQHVRRFGAVVENVTGHPCGPLTPMFTAPLMPPDAYLIVDPVEQGQLRVDYDAWLRDTEALHEAYDLRLREAARHYQGKDAHLFFNKPTPEMLLAAGSPPPALEPIRAACGGNSRWILGLPGEDGQPLPMPAWAKPFFPVKKRDAERFDDSPEFSDDEDDGDDGDQERRRPAREFPHNLTPDEFTKLQWMKAVSAVKAIEDKALLKACYEAEVALGERARAKVLEAFAERGLGAPPKPEG